MILGLAFLVQVLILVDLGFVDCIGVLCELLVQAPNLFLIHQRLYLSRVLVEGVLECLPLIVFQRVVTLEISTAIAPILLLLHHNFLDIFKGSPLDLMPILEESCEYFGVLGPNATLIDDFLLVVNLVHGEPGKH